MKSFNSEFLEKYFPEIGEKFRWYTALRFEKQLFTENETFQTISNETGEKFNSIVKELITELKEKINKSYFIRKVSRSITIAMIAMTSIASSYFVTDGLLHLIT